MTRDTFKAQGGGANRFKGGGARPARRAGFVARFRLSAVILCCALALQPTLITPGRGKVRAANGGGRAARSEGLLTHAGRSLLAVAAATGEVLRPLLPARAADSAPGGDYEPAPAAVVFLDAPVVSVVSTTDTQVALSWAPVGGAAGYRVERSPDVLSPFTTIAQPAANAYTNVGLTRGVTHLYRVRAVDAAGVLSPPSAAVMATAITYADDLIVRNVTTVKAAHVNDLRLAVAGVRRTAGLPAASWQEAVSAGMPIKAAHVNELRAELDEALAALGLATPAYTDPTLLTGPNGTRIRKEHFDELRSRARSGAGVNGSGLSSYDFAGARLDPSNRTGAGGVDPLSRNFNWSLPLVSLPGRAGLDLGLSLSYNSLVWTRSGDYVLFDGDWGWPAPGFRLGFPVVQGKFYDSQAQKAAYLMVTPSGARVSLRQTMTPTVYEAGDSSYLQLTENTDGSLTLVAPGGTRMSYWLLGAAYKCTQVKDRHGNYLTAEYNNYGNLEKVTDTLGREVVFGYYADGYLKEITQTWRREVEAGTTTQTVTETHYWARFEYEDAAVRVNFHGLTVFGPQGGQSIRALKRVKLADESTFTFNYTTWGQVGQVAARAPDGRLLNYVSLAVPADETTPQTDCPRPSERRDWAAYWNGDADGAGAAAEEAVTAYSVPAAATWQDPETGQQESGTLAQVTAPDGVVYKEYSHASGWDEGLARLTEVWADNQRKKWTSTDWTQDDEALGYEQNPRARETNVYDPEGYRRRTEVTYASFGLPEEVREYDANATTVLRRARTEYVAGSVSAGGAYAARRIIGLPAKREVYGLDGGQEKLFSKVTFEYDPGGEFLAAPGMDPSAVTQHDEVNFGAGFALRGNLSRTRRWDADDKDNQSKSAASEAGYNTLGSVVFTRDAGGHQAGVSYADSDGGARLAYPTTVTDPDGFTSSTWYNYDTGAVVKTETPKANETTDQPGPEVVRFYDAVGRPLKVKNVADGAYTKWEYGASGLYARQVTKVDTNQPETFMMSITDGAGRLIGSLREHPGSTTGYAATRSEYDRMGRAVKKYNPVEVSVDADDLSNERAWAPSGDDANPNGRGGWAYSAAEYDWKGRVRREVNPDGTDRLTEYGGCGCAGGEMVTVKGEPVPIPGSTDTGRRTQKVYHDVFGRAWKTEALNWDGTVYSTATSAFNALDQVTLARQYQGTDQSGVYREAALAYDGHGRLKSRHTPEQDQGAATVYDYYPDDTLYTVTDARGAVATYTYHDRDLVKRVEYSAPSGMGVPPSVTFGYDAAGNRTEMIERDANDAVVGRTDYHYDALSRMEWEERQFAGLTGAYRLTYDYNLAGSLKRLDYPSGAYVTYEYDQTNTLMVVKGWGPGFGQGTPLASGIKHRAWGGLREVHHGDGAEVVMSYDARLRPTRRDVTGVTYTGTVSGAGPSGSAYSYYDDGRLRYAQDIKDGRFDRAYSYDHAGRIQEAYSGQEARGGAATSDRPYRQTYAYDVWGNLTGRSGYHWTAQQSDAAQYTNNTNNRRQGWAYDAAGNTTEDTWNHTYDAAGRKTRSYRQWLQSAPARGPDAFDSDEVTIEQAYDGAGGAVKRVVTRVRSDETDQPTTEVETERMVRSTVLGGAVAYELNDAGYKVKVFMGGVELAEQNHSFGTTWGPEYRRSDPLTGAWVEAGQRREPDPLGSDAGEFNPYHSSAPPHDPLDPSGTGIFKEMGNIGDIQGSCVWNSMPVPCSVAIGELNSGTAFIKPGETDLFNLSISNAVFVPDYSDDSQDYDDPVRDARVGVTVGRFEFLGLPSQRPGSRADLTRAQTGGPNDCRRFADRVAGIASRHEEVRGFLDELARTFIGIASGDLDEMRERANTSAGERFNSTGFREELYDNIRDNQARHFIGGLILGYHAKIAYPARIYMDWGENSAPDRRVNEISVPLGTDLRNPLPERKVTSRARDDIRQTVAPADPGFKGLADEIRRRLCDK